MSRSSLSNFHGTPFRPSVYRDVGLRQSDQDRESTRIGPPTRTGDSSESARREAHWHPGVIPPRSRRRRVTVGAFSPAARVRHPRRLTEHVRPLLVFVQELAPRRLTPAFAGSRGVTALNPRPSLAIGDCYHGRVADRRRRRNTVAELGWREAIVEVLPKDGQPMHYTDIAEQILARGLKTKVGATPAASVASTLSLSLHSVESPFVYVSPGYYALKQSAG